MTALQAVPELCPFLKNLIYPYRESLCLKRRPQCSSNLIIVILLLQSKLLSRGGGDDIETVQLCQHTIDKQFLIHVI